MQETEKAIQKNPTDIQSLKVYGIANHNLGVLKVKNAPKKASESLEKSWQLAPEDYEILAYLGSAKTMVARDSWNVITKISNVNRGAQMIDKAVSKAPDNIAIRMVRATNSLALPKFFNRKKIALKDLRHIENLIERQPTIVDFNTQAETSYKFGKYYQSEQNQELARKYFLKSIKISPNGRWGLESKKEL